MKKLFILLTLILISVSSVSAAVEGQPEAPCSYVWPTAQTVFKNTTVTQSNFENLEVQDTFCIPDYYEHHYDKGAPFPNGTNLTITKSTGDALVAKLKTATALQGLSLYKGETHEMEYHSHVFGNPTSVYNDYYWTLRHYTVTPSGGGGGGSVRKLLLLNYFYDFELDSK